MANLFEELTPELGHPEPDNSTPDLVIIPAPTACSPWDATFDVLRAELKVVGVDFVAGRTSLPDDVLHDFLNGGPMSPANARVVAHVVLSNATISVDGKLVGF